MTQDVARLLPSASLLPAVLAVLTNMWNEDVLDALALRTGAEDADQKKSLTRKLWRSVIWKAGPLAIAGAIVFFVFMPPAFALWRRAIACSGVATCEYDPVAAAFLATNLLTGFVFVVLAVQVGRLLYAMR